MSHALQLGLVALVFFGLYGFWRFISDCITWAADRWIEGCANLDEDLAENVRASARIHDLGR